MFERHNAVTEYCNVFNIVGSALHFDFSDWILHAWSHMDNQEYTILC
jgi:hypothetical protein